MQPNDSDPTLLQPTIVTPGAGVEAEEYVAKSLVLARRHLRTTMVLCVIFVLVTVVSMGSITVGFARSLEPHEAATIAKGLVDEHVNDQIPQFKQYLKEKVPILIAQVPEYVKQQLPIYRTNLETQIDTGLDHYADQTSQQFSDKFDKFLADNQTGVKSLIDNNQDPQAMKTFDTNLKKMLVEYLNTTQLDGETLQSIIDKSLSGLSDIDTKMKRLAGNKNLTDDEKKTRKAIAILLKSVDTSPVILQAQSVVQNIRQNGAAQVQSTLQGVLHYTGPDEATFTEPGKPPVTFIRKPGTGPGMAAPTGKTPGALKSGTVSQTPPPVVTKPVPAQHPGKPGAVTPPSSKK
jgi:hypothetical protein